MASMESSSQVAAWRAHLASPTELALPSDYPRPVPLRVVEAEQTYGVPLAALEGLHSLAGQLNTTPETALLGLFGIVLARHAGEEDLCLGTHLHPSPSSPPSSPSHPSPPSHPLPSSPVPVPVLIRFNVSPGMSVRDVCEAVASAEKFARENAGPLGLHELLGALFPVSVSPEAAAAAAAPAPPSLLRVRYLPTTSTLGSSTESTSTTVGSNLASPPSPHLSCDLALLPNLVGSQPSLKFIYNALLFSTLRIDDLAALLIQLTRSTNPTDDAFAISLITDAARSILPDPVASLDWEGWRGAIPDILHANAEMHPDRLCVVQSHAQSHAHAAAAANGEGSEIRYSYAQIETASNVLANALIDAGVKRGDVVTLYAARSADMVAAVMGVLKSGGVFNVLDPAYPVDRQKIYLSVAKPKALVVLEKAGEIDGAVLEYISQTLPGIPILASVSLSPSGLSSPSIPHPRSTFPSIELGPDSPATLSFTSGSTGLPKGVQGRHFSLTHFYPWMSARFNLTPNSRFTMLSGIAHDPIQRDIFTPLFLGASLWVPTAEDIAEPGRLAAWIAEKGCTVTHLTPAMGQLLTANATTRMGGLEHAFFVGDVLTLRDVRRLQALAPGCAVVNMYGTTETQRAVSHYVVPPGVNLDSWKEVVPAGRGMHDVQLLVVAGEGEKRKLAGVGEVGEIYVRSGGLAEGYLEGGEDKFVPNFFATQQPPIPTHPAATPLPFFKGPRDRMYKTGDTGRYLPTGDVECTGRKDDQIKIRGFRIELGEIDTYLSQHGRVRENVTRVRRDRGEEMVLVSYIVPHVHEPDHDDLARDIRTFLSSKLPTYAIPSVFVVLRKMPLTPNGKVDKNALPAPDLPRFRVGGGGVEKVEAGEAGEEVQKLGATGTLVASLWSELLGLPISSIGAEDGFFDLGGHSILATRLVFELRKKVGVDVPLGVVFKAPKLRAMVGEVERLMAKDLNIDTEGPEEEKEEGKEEAEEYDYAGEVDVLDDLRVPSDVQKAKGYLTPKRILLTGATGFLGAFILRDLVGKFPDAQVTCLVRADSPEKAFQRVKENAITQGAWRDEMEKKVDAVCGDLAKPRFGLSEGEWTDLAKTADAIVHNGATVHWVFPYSRMKAVNVLSTKTCLELSLADPAKIVPVHFVSTTAVLDSPAFAALYDDGTKVFESDDLKFSEKGLTAGYGQTKWVSEKLVMRAREKGYRATIVRPGYILGDSKTGVTNTDDFLIRLVKGCISLGQVPEIANLINMVPVDYVSNVVASVVGSAEAPDMGVFQIWQRNHFRFIDLFRTLRQYGYPVAPTAYIPWRTTLMDHTLTNQDSALYPLLHFVMDDLPTSTKGPELDDGNTQKVTGGLDCGNMGELMGVYLAYLVEVGFLDAPPAKAAAANGTAEKAASLSTEAWFESADAERRELPKVELSAEMRRLVARNRE